jgi:membrane protein DedA with SNARE-associated domain
MPYWEFLLFDGVAALVSAPLWVCVGFWFGSDLQAAATVAGRFSNYILLGVGVVLVAFLVRWAQGRRAAPPALASEVERE